MKVRTGGLLFFLAVVILGASLMFGKAISQGVASAVSLFVNGAYVSSTNPLPISGSVVVSPGPAQTTPVTCATPNCAVVAYQGTSPWVDSILGITPTASPNAGAALGLLPIANCALNAATTNCAGVTAGQNLQVVQNAAPSATTPVNCAAAANCPVNATQVTSPWVVSTPSSAPAATATAGAAMPSNAVAVNAYEHCVTPVGGLPAATAGNAVAGRCDGTGARSISMYHGEVQGVSGAIASGVNTQLIAAVAGQYIEVWALGFQLSGINSALTVNFGYSTNACTAVTSFYPTNLSVTGTASGQMEQLWSNSATAGATSEALAPASLPYFVPLGDALCGVTAGTTVAGKFLWYASQHP